jgi:hypothetical protein
MIHSILQFFGFMESVGNIPPKELDQWEKLSLKLTETFTPHQEVSIFVSTPTSGISCDISTTLITSSTNKLQIQGVLEKRLFFSSIRLESNSSLLDLKNWRYRMEKERRPNGEFIFTLNRILTQISGIHPMVCFEFNNFNERNLNKLKFLWFAKYAKVMENVPIEIIQLICTYLPFLKVKTLGFTYFAFFLLNEKQLENNFNFISQNEYEKVLKSLSCFHCDKLNVNKNY